MSLLALKENLYTFIVRNGRVDYSRLIKWARENSIGIILLGLLIRELEKEKKIKIIDKKTITKISINGKEYLIEIPTLVESAYTTHKVVTKRQVKKTILDSILGVEKREKKKEEKVDIHKTEHKVEEKKVEAKVEISEKKVEQVEKRDIEKSTTDQKLREETGTGSRELESGLRQGEDRSIEDSIDKIRKVVVSEFQNIPHIDDIFNMIMTYLSKYWSVGEIRLRLDISKMLAHKLNIPEEELFEIVGKVLKVLKRVGIIEIVEPGIVNLIKRDLAISPTRVKLLEVLGP